MTSTEIQMAKELERATLNDWGKSFMSTISRTGLKWGISEKQATALAKLYRETIGEPGEQANGTIALDYCQGIVIGGAYEIHVHTGKIGQAVSRREAEILVPWINDAWPGICEALGGNSQPEAPPAPPAPPPQAPPGTVETVKRHVREYRASVAPATPAAPAVSPEAPPPAPAPVDEEMPF